MNELDEEYMSEELIADETAESPADSVDDEPEYSLDGDMDELTSEYPELISSVKNTNSERYSELRALGLSAREAYLATGEQRRPQDTRGHLGDSVPRAARTPASKMSRRELEIARSVFDGMSDEQIRKLYNKVNLKK